jgi:ECF sigma factor
VRDLIRNDSRFADLLVHGLLEETAEALSVSPLTVKRDWSMAKAWLYNTLSNEA